MRVSLFGFDWQEVAKVDVPEVEMPTTGADGVKRTYSTTPGVVIYLGRYFHLDGETNTYEEAIVHVVPS